jgi:hypothetical protein
MVEALNLICFALGKGLPKAKISEIKIKCQNQMTTDEGYLVLRGLFIPQVDVFAEANFLLETFGDIALSEYISKNLEDIKDVHNSSTKKAKK